MSQSVLVVGLGQLGRLFSEGFLLLGHPVVPALRGASLVDLCKRHRPGAILVATGEDDLAPVFDLIPNDARENVILIQNELRPNQWLEHELHPTVAVVWFEKRKGKAPHVVLPSVLCGRLAPLLAACFAKLELPLRTVTTMDDLCHELVLKNLYILGLNLAGLSQVNGKSPERAIDLLTSHQGIFSDLLTEILALENALLEETAQSDRGQLLRGVQLDQQRLRSELIEAIHSDPEHTCAGRSARRRLARTLEHAKRLHLKTPHLEGLASTNP